MRKARSWQEFCSVGPAISTRPVHFAQMVRPSVLLAPPARRAADEAAPAADRRAAALSRRADTTLAEQLAGALRRAHPPAPARARRPAALGARVRAAPRGEPARRWSAPTTSCWPAAWSKRARSAASSSARRRRATRPATPAGRRRSARRAQPLPISATALIRGMFQPPRRQPMPGLGTLPAEWLDPPMLAARAAQVPAWPAGRPHCAAVRRPGRRAALREALAIKLADHGVAAPSRADRHHRRRHPRARHRHPHAAARRRQRAGRRARLVGRVRAPGRARHARAAGAARRATAPTWRRCAA